MKLTGARFSALQRSLSWPAPVMLRPRQLMRNVMRLGFLSCHEQRFALTLEHPSKTLWKLGWTGGGICLRSFRRTKAADAVFIFGGWKLREKSSMNCLQ